MSQSNSLTLLCRAIVRTFPVVLALSLASAPVAECFAPPPGAEMPCCAAMRHDESCGQAGTAAQCCEHAQIQGAYGIVAAKHREAPAPMVAVLSPIVAAWLSRVPVFRPLAFDAGPPPRTTRLHIILSVFLI